MASNKFTLRSPHQPDVCVDRLNGAMNQFTLPGQRKAVGKATETQLMLACQVGEKQTGFNPVMQARLSPDRGGTLIKGRTGVSGCNILFMVFWFGFLVLFMVIVAGLFDLGSSTQILLSLPFFLVPIIMIPIAVTMIRGARKSSQGDREILLGFLKDTIDAEADGSDYTVY